MVPISDIMKMKTQLFMKVMLAVLMLAGFGLQPTSATDYKIVVIADPHVMAPSLLTNQSNSDWVTYINGSRKLIDYSQALFDQAVAEIKTLSPDLVLIVGDLTKDGEQLSHDNVKGRLDELNGEPYHIKTLVIPGNHDWGTSDAKVYGETTTDAAKYSMTQLASLYANYGFGNLLSEEDNTLTYACEPIDGLVVIGIDSGTNGVLSDETLNNVCNAAQAACNAGKQVIAMMHHPLIPHITGGDTFVETASISDYENVRNSLANAGISVIFTGHFHTSDIAKDWNDDKSRTLYDVTTGSLCSYPCDYRVVTLNGDMSSMSITTSSITGIEDDETFTADYAKNRLKNYMKNYISPKLESIGITSLYISFGASYLADAYIYHAEGDENNSNYAQLQLSSLNTMLNDKPDYQIMANSMLRDISNYGTDRADHTNDRTLAFLANAGDNSTALSTIENKPNATITLSGRTLNKDGHYNTLCLPFSLTATQLATSPLAGYSSLMELDNGTGYEHTTGVENKTLYLNFKDATSIDAGKPYIIKWAIDTDNPTITDPIFKDVTITTTSPTAVGFTGGKFVGQFSPFEITSDLLNQIIYLGANDKIGYASASGRKLNTMRAHFEVPDVDGGSRLIDNSVINFGDKTTGIIEMKDGKGSEDSFYSIDGHKFSGKPTRKGVFIRNGHKVVIK